MVSRLHMRLELNVWLCSIIY